MKFVGALFFPQTTRTTVGRLEAHAMIARQTIRTLLDLLELERIEQVGLLTKAAYVALLTAQLARLDVLHHFLHQRLELFVVVRLAQLEQTLHRVHVLIVDYKVVELGFQRRLNIE